MYNTGNPVPSAALEDMADNAQTFDTLVTQTEGTTTDRKGITRRVFQQILMDMGFQPLAGSFQTGATITARNQCLQDTSTGNFYSWNGELPKVVIAGSTPATTGGIGTLLWVDRTDLTLRNEILPTLNGLVSEVAALANREVAIIWADDYPNPQSAYDATPVGGVLRLSAKTYEPFPIITKPITIIGSGMPAFNSNFTGLTGGTIIKGPLLHRSDYVQLENFGVDSGITVCNNLYGGAAQEGISCLAFDAAQLRTGFVGRNLVAIAKDSTSAVHAFALERHIASRVDNVNTCFGVHGQAYKVIDSNISNIYSLSAGVNGVVIKRDEYAECNNSNFVNISVNCYGAGGTGSRTTENGVQVNSNRGDEGATAGNLSKINISNVSIRGPLHYGLYFSGAGVSTDVVADINVTNSQVYDAQLAGYFLAGNTERVKFTSCSASACGQAGFTDSARSTSTKMLNCFAGNNINGFVGLGSKFIVEGCTTKGNSGFGYYAKINSSCFRGGCNGDEVSLWGFDSGNYWFELGSPSTGIVQSLSPINSWVSFGGEYGPPQYFIGADGKVNLQGAISGGTLGTVALVLPVGFRPQVSRRFAVASTTSGADVVAHVIISNTGNVFINSGGTAFLSLDGISFIPSR